MVSRAAFYRYYQDKYDLAEQLFEETIHALVTNFDPLRRELLHSFAPEPTSEFWAKLLDQLAHSISPPEPWVRLFEHVAEHERLYRALLDAIIWWLEQDRPYPPRQAATYCSRLIFVIVKEAIGWE